MTNMDNVIHFPLVSYFHPDPLLFLYLTNAAKWKMMIFTDILMHKTGIFQIFTTQYLYEPAFFLEIV